MGMDPSLRDTTMNSIARWKRRLEGQGAPGDVALIPREADQLRGLALSHGVAPLADHLGRIAAAAGAPAAVIGEAVRALADFMATGRSSIAPPPTIGGGVSPSPVPPAALSMVGPPPLMMSRLGVPSMAMPSMLVDPAQVPAAPPVAAGAQPSVVVQAPVAPPPNAVNPAIRAPTRPLQRPPEADLRPQPQQPPRQASKPPLVGTMLSGGVPSRADLPPQQVPSPVPLARPAAGARPSSVQPPPQQPLPPQAYPQPSPAPGLPPSIAPAVKPPKLLEGTFLGFRAFGKVRPGGPAAVDGSGAKKSGLLGLQKHVPIVVEPPRIRAHPRTGEQRRRPSHPSVSDPQPRVDIPRWFYLVAAAIAGLGILTVAIIVGSRPRPQPPLQPHPGGGSNTVGSGGLTGPTVVTGTSAPTVTTLSGADKLPPPVLNGHAGGNETPQLKELLETQRRLIMSCQKDPTTCNRWTKAAKDASEPLPQAPHFEAEAQGPLPGWLKSYKMPDDFPVRDEPALKSLFDYMSKNVRGHADFQNKLFQCSAYQDIFDSTVIKYGVPHWITAVVFQESACNPLATSQVGAKGLWQFMPESARAYGLRVVDGEIDERLNPVKSTDAAMHFFTDLQRDLGSWDLALAAYNMGPYGILARLNQVGGHATFWELAHARLLPDETAGYVPAIEAQAIISENLLALKFTMGTRALESTAEVIVKPGMRLSLIARAASTSAIKIHELNPEFLRDVVPRDENTARVPDTQAHRAQAFLDQWQPTDVRDTCVPPEFDWGSQSFDGSKYAKSCGQAGQSPQSPGAP